MSENDQSQEKTEEPTSRKLEKAREDGQVPRSKELTTTAVLLASAIGFILFGDFFYSKISNSFYYNFTVSREVIFDPSAMIHNLSHSFADVLIGFIPFFIVLLLASILGPIALGGWLFSTKSLLPKPGRLNPIEGLKRMFSVKSLMALAKGLAKVGVMIILTMLLFDFLSRVKNDVGFL